MARYDSSAAVRLDADVRARPEREYEFQPQFEVVEGAGLDARVREGVASSYLTKLKLVVLAAVMILVLGAARVALCATTVTTLETTRALETKIEKAQSLESDLKVERSLMDSSTRIEKIATENYGMVAAGDTETITVS